MRIIGRLCIGNEKGLLLPHTTTEQGSPAHVGRGAGRAVDAAAGAPSSPALSTGGVRSPQAWRSTTGRRSAARTPARTRATELSVVESVFKAEGRRAGSSVRRREEVHG